MIKISGRLISAKPTTLHLNKKSLLSNRSTPTLFNSKHNIQIRLFGQTTKKLSNSNQTDLSENRFQLYNVETGRATPPWDYVIHIEDPKIPYIFQNREEEIKKFAAICLKNLMLSRSLAAISSNTKYTLLTAAQMWGSGKSHLGNYFLMEIQKPKFQTVLKELDNAPELHNSGVSSALLLHNFVYLQIDMRKFGSSKYSWQGILNFAVLQALLNKFPNYTQDWKDRPLDAYMLFQIVQYFQEQTKKYFFIHIDEFDLFMETKPGVKHLSKEAVNRYYEIWVELDQTSRNTGTTFYCSGRSPILYALGRGFYKTGDKPLRPPGLAECVLMDTLKVDHIADYLKEQFGDSTPKEVIALLAKLVYKRTAGVPRFVTYAAAFLKNKHPKWTKKLFHEHLLDQDFIDFVRKNAPAEIAPYQSMDEAQRNTYIELVRVAALQIPITLDEKSMVNPADFGIPSTDQGSGTLAPFLQLCTLYNLYVESVDKKNKQWKLVFPEIVLDALDVDDPHLPFWKTLLKVAPWVSSSGALLECVTQRCFLLRLGESLGVSSDHTLGDLLPFLKPTLCGNAIVTRLKTPTPVAFPKLVFSKKSVRLIETLDVKDKEKRVTQIKTFFENPKRAININVLDWKYLHTYMKPGVFYIPGGDAGKSASSDIIYLTQDPTSRVRLDTQCKRGSQEITTQMVAEEGWKAALGKAEGEPLTLLIAGFKVATALLEHTKAVPIKHGTEDVAIHFSAGTAFGFPESAELKNNMKDIGIETPKTEFVIPQGMDIVVLLRAGTNLLLTKQNADILAEGAPDLKRLLMAEMGKKRFNLVK